MGLPCDADFHRRRQPPEVLATSLIRAKLCELLGAKDVSLSQHHGVIPDGHVLVVDVLIGRPRERSHCDHGPVSGDEDRLNDGGNAYGDLFSAVCAYERADWGQCEASARKLDMGMSVIPPMYREALEWADKALAGQG